MQVNELLPKRGGRKPEWQEKNPDNQPENRYRVGLSEVKIHRPNRESNPGLLILVINSLGQKSVCLVSSNSLFETFLERKLHQQFIILISFLFHTLHYPFREIRATLPLGKTTADARAALPSPINAGSFRVSVIHRTLTRTTGSLTCVRNQSYACVYIHTGVGHTDNESV